MSVKLDVYLFVASDGFDANNRQHKQLLLCLLMTASDLSDQTKSFANSKAIAVRSNGLIRNLVCVLGHLSILSFGWVASRAVSIYMYIHGIVYIYAFIHSFIPDISIAPLPVHYYSEVLRTTASHSEALQATVSEGLAQGLYMAAGVGLKPATLWTQDTELTTEPPRLTINAQLHWLPLSACIRLKILVLVVKSKLGLAPKFLRDHIRSPLSVTLHRPLRSFDWQVIFVPRVTTTITLTRSFDTIGSSLW